MTVQILRMISAKLNNSYWSPNLNRSSCSRSADFNKTFGQLDVYSNVSCDCSFNNSSVCHVTHMYDPILIFSTFSVYSRVFRSFSISSVLSLLYTYLICSEIKGLNLNGELPVEFANLTYLLLL